MRSAGGPLETPVELGVLSAWSAPEGIVTSPEFTVTAGAPFTFEIVLNVSRVGAPPKGS